MLASGAHDYDLNFPRYLRNLNNDPNNMEIAKKTYHYCHFPCLQYALSIDFESPYAQTRSQDTMHK
jgi:hypothetical protein